MDISRREFFGAAAALFAGLLARKIDNMVTYQGSSSERAPDPLYVEIAIGSHMLLGADSVTPQTAVIAGETSQDTLQIFATPPDVLASQIEYLTQEAQDLSKTTENINPTYSPPSHHAKHREALLLAQNQGSVVVATDLYFTHSSGAEKIIQETQNMPIAQRSYAILSALALYRFIRPLVQNSSSQSNATDTLKKLQDYFRPLARDTIITQAGVLAYVGSLIFPSVDSSKIIEDSGLNDLIGFVFTAESSDTTPTLAEEITMLHTFRTHCMAYNSRLAHARLSKDDSIRPRLSNGIPSNEQQFLMYAGRGHSELNELYYKRLSEQRAGIVRDLDWVMDRALKWLRESSSDTSQTADQQARYAQALSDTSILFSPFSYPVFSSATRAEYLHAPAQICPDSPRLLMWKALFHKYEKTGDPVDKRHLKTLIDYMLKHDEKVQIDLAIGDNVTFNPVPGFFNTLQRTGLNAAPRFTTTVEGKRYEVRSFEGIPFIVS